MSSLLKLFILKELPLRTTTAFVYRTKPKQDRSSQTREQQCNNGYKGSSSPSSAKSQSRSQINSHYMTSTLKPKPDPYIENTQSEMPSYREAAFGASNSTAGKYISGNRTSSSSSKSTNNGSSNPRMQEITRTVEKSPLKRVSSNDYACSKKLKR